MKFIDKVGAIILSNKNILVVRKRTLDNREEFIIPGGKREGNETDEETLIRELKEEINVETLSLKYFDTYNDIAVFENIPIQVKAYITEIKGDISVANEIKEYIWVDRHYKNKDIKLGSILSDYIIPNLINLDLM